MNIYFGDLHNHCGITYGFGSLRNALHIARSHLDFVGVTGHAMWPDMYERNADTAFIVDFHRVGFQKLKDHWQEVRAQIAAANSEELVTFQGYEMHSSHYGDHHLVSPDDNLRLIDCESPRELIEKCGVPAIAVPHHIGYVPGYRGIDWSSFDPAISPVVEVYSKHGCSMRADGPYPYYHNMGPRDPRNTVQEGIRAGKRFSFVASTDHHAGFPGSYGDGLAAIWAEEKTRAALWEALLAGRTYAVTGDRMRCWLKVNDAWMGQTLHADKRTIACHVEGDAAISQAVLYKNGQPFAWMSGQPARAGDTRYKLRFEFGWGNSDSLYHWEGELQIVNGRLLSAYPALRGRSVLSPTEQEEKKQDDINDIHNMLQVEDDRCTFVLETAKNKSTLHPQTDQVIATVEGDEHTLVRLYVNGHRHELSLAELSRCGFAAQTKPWHSHSYLAYTAVPQSACTLDCQWEDVSRGNPLDIYNLEVMQSNNQWAFLSPCFVES